MNMESENEQMEKLLADVQRVLRENKLFIKALKDDEVDLPEEDELPQDVVIEEDEFEEL